MADYQCFGGEADSIGRAVDLFRTCGARCGADRELRVTEGMFAPAMDHWARRPDFTDCVAGCEHRLEAIRALIPATLAFGPRPCDKRLTNGYRRALATEPESGQRLAGFWRFTSIGLVFECLGRKKQDERHFSCGAEVAAKVDSVRMTGLPLKARPILTVRAAEPNCS